MTSRRVLLERLYGERGPELAQRLDRLVAAHRRSRPGTPQWSADDAWLIAYPDQFRTAAPLHDLGIMMRALAPAVNGLHLLPFHPSSGDGGFSVIDHAEVDPAFGSWADVAALGAERRLMVDAVVNHVSAQGPWFTEFLAGTPERRRFFRIVEPGTDLSTVVRPRPGPPVVRVQHRHLGEIDVWATFGADQVDLDFREPEVLFAVFEALFRYLDHGAHAVRLDAVAFIGKDPSTPSVHLPSTHTIVALLRSCIDEIDPSTVLITETNVAHPDNVAYLGTATEPEAHAVYQFSLPPLVLHALTTGDAGPLQHWAAHLEHRAGTTFLNMLAGHDGVGVRPAVPWLSTRQIEALAEWCRAAGGEVNHAEGPDGPEPYELVATWWSLCAAGVDAAAARQRHLLSHAVAFALKGIPLIYVHSLCGSANDREGRAATGVARDLNRGRFGSVERFLADLADPTTRAGGVWPAMQRMLDFRRGHPAFAPDAAQRVLATDRSRFAVERGAPDGTKVVMVANFGSSATDWVPHDDRRWHAVARSDGPIESDSGPGVVVPARSAVWLETVDP